MPRRPLPAPCASGVIVIPPPDTCPTYVYRAYCRCDDILYIGMTYNLFKRLEEHRADGARWLPKVARLEWDLYETRREAEIVETRLIATLDPLYNTLGRQHRVPRWEPLPELKPPPTRAESQAAAVQRAFAAHRALALGDRL